MLATQKLGEADSSSVSSSWLRAHQQCCDLWDTSWTHFPCQRSGAARLALRQWRYTQLAGTMRATLSSTILVVAICAWTAAAVDFPLPVASTGSPQEDTKAECARNIKRCWFLSFLKPSEPICASDQRTYSGECHLCSRVLYEGFNITKLYDGPCGPGTKARAQLVPSSLDQARQQDEDKLPYERKQETAWT